MVVVGFTLTVIVGAVPLNGVLSDKFPEMVPVPVTANDKAVFPPSQMDVVPLNVAVGRAATVTVAVPDMSAAIPAHVPFVRVTIV